MDSLYNWIVLNGIVLFNVIMGFIEAACDTVDVAVKAINDSKVSDILIFRNRNESPWPVKGNAIPVLKGSHLCYSANNKKFYDLNSDEYAASTALEPLEPLATDLLKMDNIILAELVDKSGNNVCDMSDFLHSVKWPSNSPPSVYELVLVNTLLHKVCLSKEYLSKCALHVTTLENPFLSIKLSNPLMKDDFISWNLFAPVYPVPIVPPSITPVKTASIVAPPLVAPSPGTVAPPLVAPVVLVEPSLVAPVVLVEPSLVTVSPPLVTVSPPLVAPSPGTVSPPLVALVEPSIAALVEPALVEPALVEPVVL